MSRLLYIKKSLLFGYICNLYESIFHKYKLKDFACKKKFIYYKHIKTRAKVKDLCIFIKSNNHIFMHKYEKNVFTLCMKFVRKFV